MKNKNILRWMAPVFCAAALSSCLKNINEQPDFSATAPVVELPVNSPTGDGSPNTLAVAIQQGDTPVEFDYYVNYAGSKVNATDVKVTLGMDASTLNRYNAAHSSDNLTMLPSSSYTMPLTVTIPAGQRKVQVPVKFASASLSPDITYGLPVTITDASGVVISKNFGSVILKVSVKNRYDGIYSMKGNVVRQGDDGTLSGAIKSGITTTLVTDGANACGFTQYWANGGGIAGIDNTTLRVDPVTNKVTVFSKANPALTNLPGYDNRYDPATKTFYLSFYWGNGPTHRAATDTLTYIGPR